MFNMLCSADNALTTAFSSGIATIKDDAMGMMGTAAPVALAIAGAVIAISLGWKFFKKLTKG